MDSVNAPNDPLEPDHAAGSGQREFQMPRNRYSTPYDPGAPSGMAKFRNDLRNSVLLKLFLIFVLGLILLIPSTMIQGLVYERQNRRDQAKGEVSAKWGQDQTIGGPILTIPYELPTTHEIRYVHMLPNNLLISGDLAPQVRHRGIFDVVLYNSKLKLSGDFQIPTLATLGITPDMVRWEGAYISIGIPDMHGVRDSIIVNWSGLNIPFTPGIDSSDVFGSGARASLRGAKLDATGGSMPFTLALDVNGSSTFRVMPLGKSTRMDLHSTWGNPSFTGAFLPDVREVSDKGFTATWKVLDLNRNIQSVWLGKSQDLNGSEFGVELRVPVDNYQQSDRATKYASMFIGLTFLSFFLIEILTRLRLHPIQYLLVGFAIVIFYLLLLSFSEQMGFGIAYLIASVGIIGLITFYTAAIIKRTGVTVIMALILALLYGYLYVLLQLEDWSLLLGSIGLFLILATVMYLTRKIDWFDLQRTKAEIQPEAQPVKVT